MANFELEKILLNEGAKFVMKGLPSLGYIKIIEIGVRIPRKENKPLCGQIWVNELRASGLNENGAWAAQAKVQVKLADLGDINVAGSYSSQGFWQCRSKIARKIQGWDLSIRCIYLAAIGQSCYLNFCHWLFHFCIIFQIGKKATVWSPTREIWR